MNKISAKIVADSVSPQRHRITSYILTYPRFIHAELMTHRMFSRNSASSRAIPFEKMLKMVEGDPFIPIAWQKDHKGMQGNQYICEPDVIKFREAQWFDIKNWAVEQATYLNTDLNELDCNPSGYNDTEGVTKQLCNRLLEPFMWHTVLVTATEWENFFELRCPKYYYEPENKYFKSKEDYSNYWFECFGSGIEEVIEGDPIIWWLEQSKSGAEVHIQALAEAMWDARNESTPNLLDYGQWHIPFGDKIDLQELKKLEESLKTKDRTRLALSVATARCARLSYMTFSGEIDYEKDIKLHDHLLESKHMSPFEHCAKVMSELEYYSFVKGQVPTTEDDWGILNYEYYPITYKEMFEGDVVVVNSHNGDRFGWCNNFRGFIPYRYLLEK